MGQRQIISSVACGLGLAVLLLSTRHARGLDSSPHTVTFVAADKDVSLEVLDWGGPPGARALVFLSGLGDTAHVFDKFAPRLSDSYHVLGITRRGFGKSIAPAVVGPVAYSADRLGDDVIAVIDHLRLQRPILVGHSIAGEELSSIGSRHPEKIAGLVYLDAGYGYAFYDASRGDLYLDLFETRRKLESMQPGKGPNDTRPVIRDLLETTLPKLEKDLKAGDMFLGSLPAKMLSGSSTRMPAVSQAVVAGEQKFTGIKSPALAIFAIPHDMGFGRDSAAQARFDKEDEASSGPQAKAFASGVPQAKVVLLPHANHYVFRSNEADVLREIRAFVKSLS